VTFRLLTGQLLRISVTTRPIAVFGTGPLSACGKYLITVFTLHVSVTGQGAVQFVCYVLYSLATVDVGLHRPDIELGSYTSLVSFADAALGGPMSLDEQL